MLDSVRHTWNCQSKRWTPCFARMIPQEYAIEEGSKPSWFIGRAYGQSSFNHRHNDMANIIVLCWTPWGCADQLIFADWSSFAALTEDERGLGAWILRRQHGYRHLYRWAHTRYSGAGVAVPAISLHAFGTPPNDEAISSPGIDFSW